MGKILNVPADKIPEKRTDKAADAHKKQIPHYSHRVVFRLRQIIKREGISKYPGFQMTTCRGQDALIR
jgi:hypothetical protein